MSAETGRRGAARGRRAAPAAAAAALLFLAAPAAIAGAQPSGSDRAEPPPVNMAALPTPAEVDTIPYVAQNQVGPATQAVECVTRASDEAPEVEASPPGQRRLRITEAQEFATGRGQTVAVIDSGIAPHPRLAGRLADGGDYIEGRTALVDCDGHGTPVAGIIAASRDPATGFVGVAPDANLLSIRQGSGSYETRVLNLQTGREDTRIAGDTTSMARAVVRAVQQGATVVNISEAACFPVSQARQLGAADLQAAVRFAADSNVVVVVAAANESEDCNQNPEGQVSTISAPGWFDDDVLTVAATDETGGPADFSINGPWVDVAAPGTGIVSLDAASSGLASANLTADGPAPIQGTSFSAPYVSGLAALVRERFPQLSARQVMERIQQTAQHTAGPGGRDQALGFGMIDPVAALTEVLPSEQGVVPAPQPAQLQDFRLPPPEDPLPRTVALAGSGAAVGLLGITLAIVYTVKWYRRRQEPAT